MNTTNITPQESAMVNSIWTLFQGLSQDTKKILLIRLNNTIPIRPNKKKAMSEEEALRYLDSLVVKGGKPVPPEEDGMHAFVEQKYRL